MSDLSEVGSETPPVRIGVQCMKLVRAHEQRSLKSSILIQYPLQPLEAYVQVHVHSR